MNSQEKYVRRTMTWDAILRNTNSFWLQQKRGAQGLTEEKYSMNWEKNWVHKHSVAKEGEILQEDRMIGHSKSIRGIKSKKKRKTSIHLLIC